MQSVFTVGDYLKNIYSVGSGSGVGVSDGVLAAEDASGLDDSFSEAVEDVPLLEVSFEAVAPLEASPEEVFPLEVPPEVAPLEVPPETVPPLDTPLEVTPPLEAPPEEVLAVEDVPLLDTLLEEGRIGSSGRLLLVVLSGLE